MKATAVLIISAVVAVVAMATPASAQYPGYTCLASYSVPSNDTYVWTSFPLRSGVNYLLEASGTWSWDTRTQPDKMADAKWLSIDNWATHYDDHYDASNGGLDPIGLYVGGYGDSIWGGYSPSHIYTTLLTGGGITVSFHILDEFLANTHKVYFDNSGALTVRVFEAVPEPSSLLTLLCSLGGVGGLVIRKRK